MAGSEVGEDSVDDIVRQRENGRAFGGWWAEGWVGKRSDVMVSSEAKDVDGLMGRIVEGGIVGLIVRERMKERTGCSKLEHLVQVSQKLLRRRVLRVLSSPFLRMKTPFPFPLRTTSSGPARPRNTKRAT